MVASKLRRSAPLVSSGRLGLREFSRLLRRDAASYSRRSEAAWDDKPKRTLRKGEPFRVRCAAVACSTVEKVANATCRPFRDGVVRRFSVPCLERSVVSSLFPASSRWVGISSMKRVSEAVYLPGAFLSPTGDVSRAGKPGGGNKGIAGASTAGADRAAREATSALVRRTRLASSASVRTLREFSVIVIRCRCLEDVAVR
jgi:hypothetical protein